MRFCVPIPCFFNDMDFTEAIQKVRSLGFDAVETYDWTKLDLDRVRAVCEETGVELLSMCTTDFRMTEPSYRKQWLRGLADSCAAAKRVGAKFLITQVGKDTCAPRCEQHESIIFALLTAVPILDEYGITLLIEPLNTIRDHKGYYLTSSAEAFDIIRKVNHPRVKMVFDIYHQQVTEGNLLNNILSNLDCIAHLHAAGHPGRGDLQHGEINYHYIFDRLNESGWRGACGLEYFSAMNGEDSLREFRRIYLRDYPPVTIILPDGEPPVPFTPKAYSKPLSE